MPRTPPALRQAYFDFSVLQTRWMDNDQYGHMNNMIHYSLIDTAVTNWQLQHKVFDRSGDDIRFLVVESGVFIMPKPDIQILFMRAFGLGISALHPGVMRLGFFEMMSRVPLPRVFSAKYRSMRKPENPNLCPQHTVTSLAN